MRYRAEIDGLRAIAVIPVILFHAGFETFKGGFVGVDVFFVISGYLITSIILSDINENKFSLLTFYERRIRRILPALLLVSAVCVPLASMWLLPTDTVKFAKSVIGVATFSSNITFWLDSGYFDTAGELKPLLHTWSLAVEEQYYLLFPLYLILTIRLGIRWSLVILIAIFIVSLILAHWAAFNKPGAAFYLLPTRAWELLLGSFIAFHLTRSSRIEWPNIIKQTLSLLGLSLILYSIIYFNEKTLVPGLYMLVPTIGAVLIIIFSTKGTILYYILSTRVMVGVGLISYSLYLWHQPLFAFAKYISLESLKLYEITALVVLSCLLAYLTWRFVEKPFRDRQRLSRKVVLSVIFTSLLLLAGSALVLLKKEGFPQRVDEIYSPEARKAENTMKEKYLHFTGEIEGTKPIILVIGDSHVDAWSVGLTKHFELSQYDILTLYYGGCDITISGMEIDAIHKTVDRKESCYFIQKNINNHRLMNRVEAVFLASYRPFEYNINLFRFDLIDHIKILSNDAEIFVIGNYFQFDGRKSNRTCLSLMFIAKRDASICQEFSNYPPPNRRYTNEELYSRMRSQFTVVDIKKLHCGEIGDGPCKHTFNGVPFMLDSNHLTITFIVGLLDQMVSDKADRIRNMGLAKYFRNVPSS